MFPGPSWDAGTSSKLAVSSTSVSVSVLLMVPVASASAMAATVGLLSVRVNDSLLSGTLSSTTGTDTVFAVSFAAKVSVPLVAA